MANSSQCKYLSRRAHTLLLQPVVQWKVPESERRVVSAAPGQSGAVGAGTAVPPAVLWLWSGVVPPPVTVLPAPPVSGRQSSPDLRVTGTIGCLLGVGVVRWSVTQAAMTAAAESSRSGHPWTAGTRDSNHRTATLGWTTTNWRADLSLGWTSLTKT